MALNGLSDLLKFMAALSLLFANTASGTQLSIALKDYPGTSAVIDINPNACPETIPVTINANNKDEFNQGGMLRKVMVWAQMNIQLTCPDIRVIQVKGMVDGVPVYTGSAQRTENWRLVDASPAASSPLAQQGSERTTGQSSVSEQKPQTRSAKLTPQMQPQPSQSETQYSVSTSIQQCDLLASHPDDPEAYSSGVTDEKLNANAVIQTCKTAVRAEPKIPRLHFQLARGYLKADQFENAIEQLLDAAQEGHGGALAYLGDIHVDGGPGIEADPKLAQSLYERAVASGFEPAKKILAEFEDKTDEFAKAELEENANEKINNTENSGKLRAYVMPGIVDNIYNRKFSAIEYSEAWVKDYLFNIADNIKAICESNFTQKEVDDLKAEIDVDHFNIGETKIVANVMGPLVKLAEALKDPKKFMSEEIKRSSPYDDPFTAGLEDTKALFERHSCRTQGLAQFAKNLKAYVHNDEAPLPGPNAIMNACLKDPPPSKYKASDFCICFAGGLKDSRVSQANRKELPKNFKETAIKIMNIDRNRSQFQGCRSGI